MGPQQYEDRRAGFSGWLRMALISDLVMESLDDEEANDALAERFDDDWDYTRHLARQLGFRNFLGAVDGLHDTLLMLVSGLEDELKSWPPRHDLQAMRELVHEATKHMTPLEVYAALLAGPETWHNYPAGDTIPKVGKLPKRLAPLLEKGLSSELSRVVGRWVQLDVRKLGKRRREAIEAAQAARAEALERERAERLANRVPVPRLRGKEREVRLARPFVPTARFD